MTQYTANLDYESQSGALNESVSDVFGIQVKQFVLKQEDATKANWLIGEGIWGPTIKGRALRDMQNPGTAYDDPKVSQNSSSNSCHIQLINDTGRQRPPARHHGRLSGPPQ